MSIDFVNVGIGLTVLAGASVAAVLLKRRMDAATGVETFGWAMTLMIANILQLVGVAILLTGFFG